MSSSTSWLGSFKRVFTKTPVEPIADKAVNADIPCPICTLQAQYLDAVDFHKSCEEANGFYLKKSGLLIRYYLCDACGFCFAPDIAKWDKTKFESRIYNDGYAVVDPDYLLERPKNNAEMLDASLAGAEIRHIDYGGGSGLLSESLRSKAWNSVSYDPFVNTDKEVAELGQFDLITAFEVFEHVPDVDALFADFKKLTKPDALIIFSTLLSDGQITRGQPLQWWYASPRNGHISLFSKDSLQCCVQRYGFKLFSFSPGLHVAFRTMPSWAQRLVPQTGSESFPPIQ